MPKKTNASEMILRDKDKEQAE